MSSARPRPNHHPLLILFVVGGVTCAEVRQIQDIAASHKTNVRVSYPTFQISIVILKLSVKVYANYTYTFVHSQVVVGATQLLTPQDITVEVLCRAHLGT